MITLQVWKVMKLIICLHKEWLSGKELTKDTAGAKYYIDTWRICSLVAINIMEMVWSLSQEISTPLFAGGKKMYQGEITVQVDCLKLFDTNLATAVGKILDYPEKPSFYKLLLKNQADEWKCCYREDVILGNIYFIVIFSSHTPSSSF